jgi:hypothetical protein
MADVLPREVFPFEQIKALYPDEWVLLGNPETYNTEVISGIVLMHGKDKREIAYLGRELVKPFNTYALRYTGEFPKGRKFWL